MGYLIRFIPIFSAILVFAYGSAASAATCGGTAANQNLFTVNPAPTCYSASDGQINNVGDAPWEPSYVYLDKINQDGTDQGPTFGALSITGGASGQGTWTINAPTGYSSFILLLQQSANTQKSPDWAAFVVSALTGTWSIVTHNKFGTPSFATLSHAILYGMPSQVPLPGAVWLFGTVLAGWAGAKRWLRSRHTMAAA